MVLILSGEQLELEKVTGWMMMQHGVNTRKMYQMQTNTQGGLTA